MIGTRLLSSSCSNSVKADPSSVFRSWEIYLRLDLIWRGFYQSAWIAMHLVRFHTFRWYYGIPLYVSPLYSSGASSKLANISATKPFITKCSVYDWEEETPNEQNRLPVKELPVTSYGRGGYNTYLLHIITLSQGINLTVRRTEARTRSMRVWSEEKVLISLSF